LGNGYESRDHRDDLRGTEGVGKRTPMCGCGKKEGKVPYFRKISKQKEGRER